MYACVRECVHACVRVCACVRACVCVCAVWDVDYGCLQFVFELMLVLVTACQSCVYPSASSFGQTPLHFIPYLSLLTSKLVAICMLSETGIQISPLTIDDSTPVSQSRHTLRFQPIACRSIMRCPRVLTRPEMVWQAFVPDTCLLYTSPSPRDISGSRMPSSA